MPAEDQITFKEATSDELSFALELYNYYLLNTTVTCDYEAIPMEELKVRLSYGEKNYRTFLVREGSQHDVIGFCFLKQFRKKPAYDRTAEIGVYLKPETTGKGIGQAMVRFLEGYAKENQIDVIVATISGENTGSIKLFEKMGYERCAHFKEVAVKFGRRIDLVNYEKILVP